MGALLQFHFFLFVLFMQIKYNIGLLKSVNVKGVLSLKLFLNCFYEIKCGNWFKH